MGINIIKKANALGIHIYLENGELKVKGQRESLTKELLAEIRASKSQIIQLLSDIEKTKEEHQLVEIEPVSREQQLPLSYAQQGIWLTEQLEQETGNFNIIYTLNLQGALNAQFLEQAIQGVIERHEVLRSNMVLVEGQPVQKVCGDITFTLSRREFSHLSKHEQSHALELLLSEQANQPFALETDLMLRSTLVKLSDKEHVLVLAQHHLVSDGWSFGILVKEISALYHELKAGQPANLPELPIQYADYAVWQREWMNSDAMQSQLDYWKNKLSDLPACHSLPLSFTRPQTRSFEGASYVDEIAPTVVDRLNTLAAKHDATLFMLLNAIYTAWNYRYSGAVDTVIGTPVANREQAELANLLGFFVNNMVVRNQLDAQQDFEALVINTKATMLEAYERQQVPFEIIVKELKPERRSDRSPIFQIMLVMHNNEDAALELPDLKLTSGTPAQPVAQYDLTLNFTEYNGMLLIEWIYATELFSEAQIKQMSSHFNRLVELCSKQPNISISRLNMLSEAESTWLVEAPNPAKDEVYNSDIIHELVGKVAAQNAHGNALICGDEHYSYQQLDSAVNRLAKSLLEMELSAQAKVGVYIEPSCQLVISLLAILKAGLVYVPLDRSTPNKRLQHIVTDCGLKLVLTTQETEFPVKELEVKALNIKNLISLDTEMNIGDVQWPKVEPHWPAYVIYTSGSTGMPKGVVVSHGNASHFIHAMLAAIEEQPKTWLLLTSISFDIALFEWMGALATGGSCIIAESSVQHDAFALANLIDNHEIDLMQSTPSRWSQLLDSGWTPSRQMVICSGGERISDQVIALASVPNVSVYNCYGPTEATVWSAVQKLSADAQEVSQYTIGKSLGGYQHYIVGPNLELLPPGAVGELCIGGAGVSLGYHNRPELMAEKFIKGSGWADQLGTLYLSGDLARLDEKGNIACLGRKDEQIKLRGHRIELGEIEHQLSAHESVNQAAVILKQSGENQILVAYLTPAEGVSNAETLTGTFIRSEFEEILPQYMLPSQFVVVDQLPLTVSGKVDKAQLQHSFEIEKSDSYEIAETVTELLLVNIWAELLDIPESVIGKSSNFFELGGHSLLAVRMTSKIYDAVGINVGVKGIFTHTGLASLAKHIEQSKNEAPRYAMLNAAEERSKSLLSYSQNRLWITEQLVGENAQYNIPGAVSIKGEFSPQLAEQALTELVNRHTQLRVHFEQEADVAWQKVGAAKPVQLGLTDLSSAEEESKFEQAHALIGRWATQPFNLERGGLFRANVIVMDKHWHVLSFTLHHIISDAWSMQLLISDFCSIYMSLCDATSQPLPALEHDYFDYIHWQREWMQSEDAKAQLSYWTDHLQGAPSLHNLPLDYIRPAEPRREGARHSFNLSQQVTQQLKRVSVDQGVTLFMLLHGALSLLVARYSGDNEVLIGTPVANRLTRETESIVGFFANTLVLRSTVEDDEQTVLEFFEYIRKINLDAQDNQAVPFEHLVEVINPIRSAAISPLFQIALSLNSTIANQGDIAELSLEPWVSEELFTKFDLTLQADEMDSHIALCFEYDRGLFKPETIERFADSLQCILNEFSNSPQKRLCDVEISDPGADLKRLELLRGQVKSCGETAPLHHRFEQHVHKAPDAIAIYDEQAWSYTALNEKANQVAHGLLSQGISQGMRVGLSCGRGVEQVIGLLGILKSGAAYVPLDPDYPASRLNYILTDAQLDGLVYSEEGKASLEAVSVPNIPLCFDALAHFPTTDPEVELSSEALAYVIYTSGSTGQPKGVEISHHNVCRLFSAATEFDITSRDVWTLFHSFSFDFSVWELWGALLHGGSAVVVPSWVARSPEDFYQLLQQHQVTVLSQTPGAFYRLMEVDSREQSALALRYVVFGGEALNLAALAPWVARRGDSSPELVNMYGITETTVHVTHRRILQSDIAQSGQQSLIGRPLSDLTAYVLTPSQRLAPIGVAGELYIGGEGLAKGYLNKPELTATRFIDNPLVAGERLYRTGDVARYLGSGELEYLGRCDEQVKIRGFRIEPGEVSAALLQVAGVKQAFVQALGEPKSLVAYVVPESDNTDIGVLQGALRDLLPEHMIPSAFVLLAALPLTAHGKVDRKALPEVDMTAHQARYVAPQTELESLLAEVWSSVLDIERVGREDNFFNLGGDSMKAITAVSRSRAKGAEYSVKDLFQYQRISALANAISQQQTSSQDITEVAPFSLLTTSERAALADMPGLVNAYPQSHLQQGMLFHNMLEEQAGTYHDVFSFQLAMPWDEDAFSEALEALVARHGTMRSILQMEGARPLQLEFAQLSSLPLSVEDLRAQDEAARTARVTEWEETERERAFDLTEPAWLIHIQRLTDEQFYFHLSFHHALWDGWSVATLNTELFKLYRHALASEALPKLPAPLGYEQFIALEQAALTSSTAKDYWLSQLQDAPQPWWLSQPRRDTEKKVTALTEAQTAGIQSVAQRLAVQEKSVLLSMHAVLLSLISGQDDVVTSVVSNGRPEAEGSEQTLGLFLNSQPLRVDKLGESWGSIIKRVDDALVTLSSHRYYPLNEIQRLTGSDYSASIFNYVDFHVYDEIKDETNVEGGIGFEKINYLFETFFAKEPQSGLLSLTLKSSSHGISSEFLGRIERYFIKLIDLVCAEYDQPVKVENILSQSEVGELLSIDYNEIGDTQLYQHVHKQVEHWAVTSPDAIAVITDEAELSFSALNENANRLARYLQDAEVGIGDAVGICMEPCASLVVAMVAALKVGATYVPMEPKHPEARLQYFIDDAEISLVIVTSESLDTLPMEQIDIFLADDLWEEDAGLPEYSEENLNMPLEEFSDAYVIYTSGTTGKPKGVAVPHSSLNNYLYHAQSDYFEHTEGGVVSTAFAFDATVTSLIAPLYCGKPCQLLSTESDLIEQLQLVMQSADEPLVFKVTPSHLKGLVAVADMPLSELQHRIVVGGEQFEVALLKQCLEQVLPNGIYINEYGPTEATVGCTTAVFDRASDLSMLGEALPIGKPILGTQLYVLDSQLRLSPKGAVGQLYISGHGLASGYLNNTELTATKFIANPFSDSPDSRMYETGDLVQLSENGVMTFIGRQDEQQKLNGYRIELGEIQFELEAMEHVSRAEVLFDAQSQKVRAFIIADGECSIDLIKSTLSVTLPDYMMPASLTEVTEIPLTINGKLDKQTLLSQALSTQSEVSYQGPETAVQKTLCSIWQKLLRIEKVGIHDNFFALGGDSILMLQVMSAARKEGLSIAIKTMIANPTIASLTPKVERIAKGGKLEVSGSHHLLPIQQGLLNSDHKDHFLQSLCFTVTSELTKDGIVQLIGALYERHSALRLSFTRLASGVWESSYLPVDKVNAYDKLEFLQSDANSKEAWYCDIKQASAKVKSAYRLEDDGLFKVVLFRHEKYGQVVLLLAHHMIVDGVSWRVILKDMSDWLSQLDVSDTIEAIPETTSYQAWGRFLHDWSKQEEVLSQKSYWLTQLNDNASSIIESIPDEINNTQGNTALDEVVLTKEQTKVLLQECLQYYGVQINELLLGAIVFALSEWADKKSVRVFLEGHGREPLVDGYDFSETVGWFTSLYPVDLSAGMSKDYQNVLSHIQSQLQRVPQNGIGFGVLQHLSETADFKHADELQKQSVLFNYLGQFDQTTNQISQFEPLAIDTGSDVSLQRQREYALGFVGSVVDGCLRIQLDFNPDVIQPLAITELVKRTHDSLESILNCVIKQDF
ncbi:amino acid adenylation domain-containing protein [Pseudoalteromonas luteoviolacea]|uniref:non-ribosomal peptide synthetase n=1 Tax=Pseudoalteromonas luteoviolacea TaxID=43657 RepID=UPI001F2AA4E9|nr:non-ribosomal peptide synthetase [Pseudoalteromonas luteoviolacea]MCF6437887.1 amino acid adenylation domain-containing protein [Pseudoalteromonas luteoviolacea]